jgi:hypothetical protein
VSIARVVCAAFYGQHHLSLTVNEDLYIHILAYQEPSRAEYFWAKRADALENETCWMMVAGIESKRLEKKGAENLQELVK